jgi:hypothetical protein
MVYFNTNTPIFWFILIGLRMENFNIFITIWYMYFVVGCFILWQFVIHFWPFGRYFPFWYFYKGKSVNNVAESHLQPFSSLYGASPVWSLSFVYNWWAWHRRRRFLSRQFSQDDDDDEATLKQGCQIFFVQHTKTGEILSRRGKITYQLAIKYTKWPDNWPNGHIGNVPTRSSQNYPNLDFWFENIPSGNPALKKVLASGKKVAVSTLGNRCHASVFRACGEKNRAISRFPLRHFFEILRFNRESML